MRKIFFVLIFIVLQRLLFGQATTYHPFPDSNAIWSTDYSTAPFVGGNCEKYKCEYSGDTVIGNFTYHKINISGSSFQYNISTGCDFSVTTGSYNYYWGAIREDTISKKIFAILQGLNTDTLLYDFSLTVGDTVKGLLANTCSPDIIVTNVDSILIGGNYRKHWNISRPACLFNGELIEGIGSTFGLVEQFHDFESSGVLVCFSNNDTSYYPSYSTTSGCQFVLGINQERQNLFEIYPNPFFSFTTIKIKDNIPYEHFKFTLKDMYGHNIQLKIEYSSGSFLIDKGNLKPGIYFLSVKYNNEIFVKKIILL